MPPRPGSRPPVPLAVDDLPRPLLRRDVDDGLESAARAGHLVRVRRGAYVVRSDLGGDPYGRARRLAVARTVALVRQSNQPVVVSHASAALLWGLPLLDPPERVHVVQRSRPGSAAAPDVVRHTHRLVPEDVAEVAGIAVTSLERTVVDCARSSSARGGLVVADAGLRAGADPSVLAALLARAAGGRGVRRARAVLALADAGAESAGESLARAALLALGLPAPVTQLRVDTAEGAFWSDMGWPEWRLLVEYDGAAKYAAAGADVGALVREKRREDLVRDEGWRVLRMTAKDLDHGTLAARVHRLLPPEARRALVPRPFLLAR